MQSFGFSPPGRSCITQRERQGLRNVGIMGMWNETEDDFGEFSAILFRSHSVAVGNYPKVTMGMAQGISGLLKQAL